ncbi:hypothetical protein D3C84_956150 [compost metagenome]
MRRTRFIQALLLLIQASWVWFISQRVKRWVRANGNTLKIATQNRNEQSRIVFSASNNDAITPRAAAGRKSSI